MEETETASSSHEMASTMTMKRSYTETKDTTTVSEEEQPLNKRARIEGDEQPPHLLPDDGEEDEPVDWESLPHWRRVIGNDFTLYRTCIDMISRFPRKSLKHWDVTWNRYRHLRMKRRDLTGMKHDIIQAILKARNMSDEAVPSSFFDETLEDLSLAGASRLTSTKLNHMQIARHSKNLVRLDLRGCFYLDNYGLDNLLEECKKLKFIGIQGCRKLSGSAINSLCHHAQIEGVDLGGCYNISGDKIRYLIANHPNKANFQELGLSGAARSNDELVELVCQHMPNIETLHIGYFEGTDKGIELIATQLKHLKHLKLHWSNSISDAALGSLGSHAQNLECLDITGCEGFTAEAIQHFLHQCAPAVTYSSEENAQKRLKRMIAPFAPIDNTFLTFVSDAFPGVTLQVNP